MKPKVYVTMPIPEDVRHYMTEHCEIRQWTGEKPIPRETLLQELNDIEGLYTSGGSIDEELLNHAPHLKVVSNVSVGYNNFDVDAMKKHNVIGTNTPYVLDETVADLTFALILGTARRIPELDRLVKDGNWKPSKDDQEYFGIDVHSSTIGIIGMGRIGEAIAGRAKFGFNMDVLYYNRNRKPEAEETFGAEYNDLESLLKKSDYVVLLTPLTPETHHLIGEKEFKLMKKSAFFINVSRGQTVDEQALIQALQNKEIYGAGLDVFQKEPVEKDNPLLKMSNVVTVPHIGSATAQTREAMTMRAAENVVAVLTGKGPIDPVTE
ncbi:2-hydroxyacid dehydrogenase [Lederbergia citrea]|uniref:D-glycerate dehydrogenase n=1 Tax=Lederbergia citrea TaxID=2833581 RepID=A0A942Z6N8_9BACI|nr:D-glycerate dehydrogenase [Lederbergia citrea]MBS4206064.1 D-glycerate dehydrogenase [Lederbergia citrea]MBS4224487.1 D-glycerate dehydrogenase [Lederbergia citrea]